VLTLAERKEARNVAREFLHGWLDSMSLAGKLTRDEYRSLKEAAIAIDRFRGDGRLDKNARPEEHFFVPAD
jgi:hypothetical protein